MPCADQMVGTCLRCRIGAARIIGRGLVEHTRPAKGPKHLIRTDVMEPESYGPTLRLPITARSLKHIKSTSNIGFNEVGRGIN